MIEEFRIGLHDQPDVTEMLRSEPSKVPLGVHPRHLALHSLNFFLSRQPFRPGSPVVPEAGEGQLNEIQERVPWNVEQYMR